MSGDRILFLSHTHVFGSFRVGSHHYARELARRGIDVVHLSTPISLAHWITGRVNRSSAQSVPIGPYIDDDGVTHLVPRTALPRPLGAFRVSRELARHGIAQDFDTVLIDQPLLWDDTVPGIAGRLVYRPTDMYPSGAKNARQRDILADADAVVATSAEVLRRLGPVRVPTLVLENGVDAAHFAPPPGRPAARPATCVYVGALDNRFDWGQFESWARTHANVRFVVAGPASGADHALPPNVHFIGAYAYEHLPSLLHEARVGLLPLSDDPLNAGRSPMKLHEYLAAGLSVVARETPVIRADEGAGVFTYAEQGEAGAALDRALAVGDVNTAGQRRAESQSWQAKTDALETFRHRLVSR